MRQATTGSSERKVADEARHRHHRLWPSSTRGAEPRRPVSSASPSREASSGFAAVAATRRPTAAPSNKIDFVPKVKLETSSTTTTPWRRSSTPCSRHAAAGEIGDGKLWVSPVDEVDPHPLRPSAGPTPSRRRSTPTLVCLPTRWPHCAPPSSDRRPGPWEPSHSGRIPGDEAETVATTLRLATDLPVRRTSTARSLGYLPDRPAAPSPGAGSALCSPAGRPSAGGRSLVCRGARPSASRGWARRAAGRSTAQGPGATWRWVPQLGLEKASTCGSTGSRSPSP